MANPTPDPTREQMDRYLESQGLLNYQTQGLNAQEIAQRYANANVKVNQNWFQNNYKASMPPAQYQNITQPQIPIQNQNQMPPQSLQGMGYAGGWANQRRLGQGAPLTERDFRTGLSPDERDERAKAVEYKTDEKSGLVVKEIKPQFSTVWLEDPNQPQAQPAQFATIQQALMGEANWGDVSVAERRAMLKNPDFYKNGDITKFPTWMQQQVIADPDFQWDKLPKWQRWYFELSSSPAGMGAFQGGTLGLIGGPLGSVAGAVTGAVLGWGAGKSGYDPTKEAWEQTSGVSKAFGYLNWLAEQGEKAIGLGVQAAAAVANPKKYGNLQDVFTREGWNAGSVTFENMAQTISGAQYVLMQAFESDDPMGYLEELHRVAPKGTVLESMLLGAFGYVARPMDYYLGAEDRVVVDNENFLQRMADVRERIQDGEKYREVMMDFQTGVLAQVGDMAGQALADPLNVMPNVMPKVGAKIADVQGNTVAAQALRQSGGLTEAARRYKTLVQTGEALKIDPQFQVDRMGWFSRQVAGITKSGEIRTGSLIPTETGLLAPVKDKAGFIRSMTEQTPHSRAQAGANMFYENVSALLTLFDDPTDAAKYLRALANNDMETWRGLGTRFAESPEFYTVLPALKEFNTNLLDGVVQQWDLTAPNRDMLTRIADVMGEQTGRWLEDTAKRGTFEQDYQRLVKRVHESNSPQAQALKADIEAGRLTVETLRQTVDIFTGEGALPWHPGQWKAMVLDSLGTHFDEWVTKRLMLDKSPEAVNAFYRTTALLKQAQSILLLGGSPGYAITNGLSNMMHRAVSGIYGYLTPKQINSFLDRFGVTPARMDEGVGIGGMVEQAAGKSQVQTRAMTEAVKGTGPLATARSALAKISRGMPMSKLSSQFEVVEGRQGTAIAMKQWWNQSWRRGVGFSRMRPELVQTLQGMGVDPNRIYAAIEAGMNQGEIERALTGRFEGVQARSLVDDAARRNGMTASQAAEMLDKIGVLDTLDTYLKGQTTRDGVQAAFRRAERVAQDWMDMQTGEDLKAIAESVKQRVGLETPAAALDVVQKAHGAYTDTWMDHYYRFGEVMQDLTLLDDPAQRQKAIDYQYQVSDTEFRRVNARNAANYKGIFEAWGLSGDARTLRVLQSMGEGDAAMTNAYRQMREIRRGFFEKYRNDWDNPAKWDEFNANQSQIDRLFRDAFQAKHDAEVKMGGALAEIYESLYGPAAGEAARAWWEDVTAFNDEIVKRERDFRGEMAQARAAGVPNELIAAQKQKYYSETKIGLIAELDRINGEGIARLERVIRRGPGTGDGGPLPTPDQPAPTVPEGGRAVGTEEIASPAARNDIDEVNALMAAAEQRQAAEQAARQAHVSNVWEVAEEYWGLGANYSRTVLQDRFALLSALKKTEYGGIPDLRGLDDPRLTPERARSILETRKAVKEAAGNAAAERAFQVTEGAPVRRWDATAINENTTILRAVALHGGIDLKLARDLTGEGRPKSAPGVFTRKGMGIDEMARMLADDGYPIDLNHPDDPGGIRQTTELINRARAGNAVYPMGHDFSADIAKAEAAWAEAYESVDTRFPPDRPFDATLFQAEFARAVDAADLGQVYELIGAFPDEMLDTPDPSGGTWRDYLGRVADETAARVERAALEESVADGAARAELAMQDATAHGEAVTTRQLLKEQFETAFQLDEAQATAWMEVADAAAGWFSKVTGGSADDFYSRYYGEVLRDVEGARKGDGELSQAGTSVKKGAVTFDGDGIKATIKAFEAADFSTLVHENGHVFRRVLKDVAETTGNPYVVRDLETIETWAGVKDGAWNRAAEEKFARGFERYMAEGKAPTPALARAFESFRQWMLEIYRTLTGNAIDVKLTDEVRRVFDRMLGAENLRIELNDMLLQMNYDPKQFYVNALGDIVPRPKFEINVDMQKLDADVGALDIEGMQTRVNALREQMRQRSAQPMDVRRIGDDAAPVTGDGYSQYAGTRYGTDAPVTNEQVRALKDWTLQQMRNNPDQTLFQMAEPTESAAFRNWFGESKVVDDDGRPLGVFHGAGEQIQIFDKAMRGVTTDAPSARLGFFFTDNESIAKGYADFARPREIRRLQAEYQRLEKKAQRTGMAKDWDAYQDAYIKFEDAELAYKGEGHVEQVYLKMENPLEYDYKGERYREESYYDIIKTAIQNGNDGVILRNTYDAAGNINDVMTDIYVVFEPEQIKSVANRGTWDPTNPNILFQEADQPFGAYDEASQFLPMSEVMDEGWRQNVTPLLKAMEEGAVGQLREGGLMEGAVQSMDPEGQAMLRQYMQQVKNEMATTKLSTVRWGERQRDFALLNYSKRYGIDRVLDAAFPYQFYYSRSLFTWAARSMDFPALYSNYARMRMQQQRYERDIPERLRGRIKINAPWLPEWMGGSMYIDPISNLFFPAQVLRPFERMHQDKNYQMIEAERILQEWMEDGQYSENEIINAAQSQSGTVWERAFEEAQLRREAEISNPFDFFTTMFGPAWYLSTPLNLMGIETPFSKGDPNKVTGTPLGNTSRALETVTKGTWAEPVGQIFGLLGKAEDWTREQFDLPTRGEYGEYYTKRQVANMVAEGLISADEAQMAMIEKQGAIWEQAAERVNLELAMRVPTMSALYGALHEGPAAGAQAFLPSLFGSGLLPSGELEYRGLKQEWNEAWKRADGGDTQAVRNFFEEHPEYQAYLAKGKDDEQLLRSFLIGQIWDQYMELGTTNQRQARAEMGALFQQSFLDKETRSYETLDVETLTDWARMLGGMVPSPPAAEAASPQMANNLGGAGSPLNLFSPAVTTVTDEFFRQRTEMFPNWFEVQSGYYDLPKGAARTRYLLEHPELKEFWDWRQRWYGAYPQYKPVMDGTAFKRVDTTNWPPMLEDFVRTYAYTGKGLPQGARKALEQVWILEGMPLGDFETWLTSQVVPAMRYGE